MRWLALTCAFAFAGFLALHGAAAADPPRRVVSMNLCTDQLAMLIAAPGQLISVSHLAPDPSGSMLSEQARQYPINHGQAEELFLLQPDLILAGSYTTRATVALLRRLGFRVEVFSTAQSLHAVRANIRRMGVLLGRKDAAAALIESFDARIDRARPKTGEDRPTVATYDANSYTSGVGTLSDAVIAAAGLRNLGSTLGLRGTARLSLEALIAAKPDFIMFGKMQHDWPSLAQEVFRHPALRQLLRDTRVVNIRDAMLVCDTPFVARAVEILAAARAQAAGKAER